MRLWQHCFGLKIPKRGLTLTCGSQAGTLRDAAILVASVVKKDGKRSILGNSVSRGEAEAHWRVFLEGLVKRGLHGVQLIINDDHAGMEAAHKAVFTGASWQRCQFHLQ